MTTPSAPYTPHDAKRVTTTAQRLPWPPDWDAHFGLGAGRPLIVEIGFGYGHFLLHLARTHPGANVLGLEIAHKPLETVEQRLHHARLPNVRLLNSPAQAALAHLFTPGRVAAFHINFPDPWFKTRHGHRRLMQRTTVDALANRLAPGGTLTLATDILAYAEMTAALLAATPGLANTLPAAWSHSPPPGRVITKYERRAREQGRSCAYFVYTRTAAPAPDVPVLREHPMPHALLRSPLTLEAMHARFRPAKTDDAARGVHVHLMDAYLGPRGLLVEMFVREPSLDQHVAFMVTPRSSTTAADAGAGTAEYVVQLSGLGHPRPSDGVHVAARVLVAALAAMSPEAVVEGGALRA